ncbi:MAG: hypothetical protein ACLPVY_25205 [Acidimicrobiia bacterium]
MTTREAWRIAVILGAVAVFVVMFVFVSFLGHAFGTGGNHWFTPTGNSVVMTSYGPDTRGHVEIRGSVHNNTATPADYVVDATVQNQFGVAVADGNAALWNVAAGTTVQWQAPTKVRFEPGTTCQLEPALFIHLPRS